MNERILVVDDEPDICEFIKRKLERTGYSVKVAQNGQEGLGIAEQEDFELIATDIVMPDMSGLELFEELKKNPKTANVPVVVFSAKVNMENQFKKLGIDNFMSKPFDGQALVDKITDIIHNTSLQKKVNKIMVAQNDNALLQNILRQLGAYGWIVQIDVEMFGSIADLVSKQSGEEAKIVLVDLFKRDGSVIDFIKILRDHSKKDIILTYTKLDNKDLLDLNVCEQLAQKQSACMTVGANQYIGQLNKFSFILMMYEYC